MNGGPAHKRLDYQILMYVISSLFPLGELQLQLPVQRGTGEGMLGFEHQDDNILWVPFKLGIQEGVAAASQLRHFKSMRKCISMHLVLTQPPCVHNSQSLSKR